MRDLIRCLFSGYMEPAFQADVGGAGGYQDPVIGFFCLPAILCGIEMAESIFVEGSGYLPAFSGLQKDFGEAF